MSKYPHGFRTALDKSPDSNIPRPGEDTSTWECPPTDADEDEDEDEDDEDEGPRDDAPISRVIVALQIQGDPSDAFHVVDSLLDGGLLQDAINDHDCDAGPLRVKTAVVRLDDLTKAALCALPLLCKLGDFIGNGPVDPNNPRSLGERCDVIGALRDALGALGVPESDMAPTRGAVQLALHTTVDGKSWRLMRVEGERCAVEAITRIEAANHCNWTHVCHTTLPVGAPWVAAIDALKATAEPFPAVAPDYDNGVALAETTDRDGRFWRLVRDTGSGTHRLESISAQSRERRLCWAHACEVTSELLGSNPVPAVCSAVLRGALVRYLASAAPVDTIDVPAVLDVPATASDIPDKRRAVIAYRRADGTEANHAIGGYITIEGTDERIRAALHGCLSANNASAVWATDARTGALIAGFDYAGAALTVTPVALRGFFDANMRTVYPPSARITERVEGHVYLAVSGYSSTVLVYASGNLIGYADPQDLGYTDAAAMIKAGVAS